MRKLSIGSLALFLAVFIALPFVASSAPMKKRVVKERQGDNTLHFRWDAKAREVTEASSSRMLLAGQEVELLTSLSDRTGKIEIKAVLKNISDDTIYLVDGRFVHVVWQGEEIVKTLRSRPLHTSLRPGQKVSARFSYALKSGDYSARTDLSTTARTASL